MKRWKDWQTKGHPENPRRLVYVSLLDRYLVVALPQVQLAEDAAAVQPGGEVLDVGQRVCVRRCSEV